MNFQRPDIIRPPSEWRDYFLPLTRGCSNNTCTFCNRWGEKLHLRELEDVKLEIDALALFMHRGLTLPEIPPIVYAVAQEWDGNDVFLLDSDALVYPFPRLKETLQYLNLKLPEIRRIGAYATAQDILRRTVDELKELQALKLGILYIGLESGDDEILQRICKNVTAAQVIEAVQKVKAAGILTSVTVILGLGGVLQLKDQKAAGDRHTLATARVLSEMDPDYVGALTMTLVPGTPMYADAASGKFHLITPFESLQELLTIVKNANFSNCFFSSMHASNYFSVRGTLPQDKEKMIKALEQIIKKGDPNTLRPEFLRGL
ncbi:MAG: radical SAM protein [Dehalococcoidales bacterium]